MANWHMAKQRSILTNKQMLPRYNQPNRSVIRTNKHKRVNALTHFQALNWILPSFPKLLKIKMYPFKFPTNHRFYLKYISYFRNRVKQPTHPFVCKLPPCMGGKEPCQSTLNCGCGEYCNTKSNICRMATCTSGFQN